MTGRGIPEALCLNCGARLSGPYCSACGQEAGRAKGRVRTLLDGLAELASLDSRLPRSLVALATPGRLATDYAEGKRVPYVPPLRLALMASIGVLILLALRLPEMGAPTAQTRLATDLSYAAREWAELLTLTQFLALPLVAGLLGLLYWGKRGRFLDHFSFVLYFHTAVCASVAVVVLVSFGLGPDALGFFILTVFALIFFPYLGMALHRFYGGARWRAGVSALVVAMVYLFLSLSVTAIVLGIAISATNPAA